MSGSGVFEEVKSKLDIVQLVSEYIPLKKAGVRFKAPCPFHHEKDPSFYVNPDWQMWKCFGCGEGGDIFDFVMRMEGVEKGDALRLLAKKAGVVLKDEDVGKDRERQRLFDVNRLAALFYHETLLRSPLAETARAYAGRRGLQAGTMEDFMIGYAPDDWHALTDFLKKKGYSEYELLTAGLAAKGDLGPYDRFRGRLMFPIRNAQGQYAGFSGRIMPGADGKDPPDAPKYINTVETPVYRKSDVLFAFDLAKQEIRRAGTAIVVEGNMDAIASHQAGVRNVVASSGTAFTAEQLGRLRRVADRLVLSFDMDAAGEQAARRSIDAAVTAEFEVRVLRLPPDAGKDPDDCIRRDPELWKKAIADARPHMEWYFGLAEKRLDLNDPYAKRRAAGELLAEIAKLPAAVERSHWIKRLAELLGTREADMIGDLESSMKKKPAAASAAVAAADKDAFPVRDRHYVVSEYLLGMAASWPDTAEAAVSRIDPAWFNDAFRPLYTALIMEYNERQNGAAGISAASPTLSSADPVIREQAAVLQLLAEKEFGTLEPDERRREAAKLIGELKELHTARLKRDLVAAMRQAEKAGDTAKITDVQRQLNELSV